MDVCCSHTPPKRPTGISRKGMARRARRRTPLFSARAHDDELDLPRCVCTSMFPRRSDGKLIPEMDAYRWAAPDEVERYASRSLTRLVQTTLSLAELHNTL